MQELTQKEIQEVNGGGFIGDVIEILWDKLTK